MELSGLKVKNFLKIFPKSFHREKISYIFPHKNFLDFKVLIFLALRLKIFSFFLKKRFFYILGIATFLLKDKKIPIVSWKKYFLIFWEIELFKKTFCISGASFPSSEKISYILKDKFIL